MASLSPQGERAVLALLAEQYTELVTLRETLTAERHAHQLTREALTAMTEAVTRKQPARRARSTRPAPD